MKRFRIKTHFQNVSQLCDMGSSPVRSVSRQEWAVLKLVVMILICLFIYPRFGASATELITIDSGICTAVVDHKAVGIGEVFGNDVGKLFCFTRVLGPYLEEKGQHIVHVWYYKESERARITLPVRSSNWGTYSSKIIRPFEAGDWHVDVLDPDGEVISVLQFYIKE